MSESKLQKQFFGDDGNTNSNSKKFNAAAERHKNKRAGLDASLLTESASKHQKENANDKINTDLRYNLIEKHSARKRNKRKGLLVDYGESDSEDGDSGRSGQNMKNDVDSDEERESYSKSARFGSRKTKVGGSVGVGRQRFLLVQQVLNQVVPRAGAGAGDGGDDSTILAKRQQQKKQQSEAREATTSTTKQKKAKNKKRKSSSSEAAKSPEKKKKIKN